MHIFLDDTECQSHEAKCEFAKIKYKSLPQGTLECAPRDDRLCESVWIESQPFKDIGNIQAGVDSMNKGQGDFAAELKAESMKQQIKVNQTFDVQMMGSLDLLSTADDLNTTLPVCTKAAESNKENYQYESSSLCQLPICLHYDEKLANKDHH